MLRKTIVARRCGFTIAELLVVIAIIAVLIGLLLPAVQKARCTSDGLGCMNNLREIAKAIHLYHDTEGQLPSFSDGTTPRNWCVGTLPYLEKGNLFGVFQLDLPPSAPANLQAAQLRPKLFCCPSNQADTSQFLLPEKCPITSYWFNQNLFRKKLGSIATSSLLLLQEAPADEAYQMPWILMPHYPHLFPQEKRRTNHAGPGSYLAFADGHVDFYTGQMPVAVDPDGEE